MPAQPPPIQLQAVGQEENLVVEDNQPPGLLGQHGDESEDEEEELEVRQHVGERVAENAVVAGGQSDQDVAEGEEHGAGDGHEVPAGGERGNVPERVTPLVPPPKPDLAENDGWLSIDQLGGWKCIIAQFGVLENVPSQYRAIWASAWTQLGQRGV